MPQGKLLEKWPDIVGTALEEHIIPSSFKNGVLECLVSHSALVQEHRYLEPQILKKIHAFPEGRWIKSLKFTLFAKKHETARLEKIISQHNAYQAQFDVELNSALSLSEIKTLEQSISPIKDEQTQQKLLRLFKAIKAKQNSLVDKGWKTCDSCQGYYPPPYSQCIFCHPDS